MYRFHVVDSELKVRPTLHNAGYHSLIIKNLSVFPYDRSLHNALTIDDRTLTLGLHGLVT